MNVKNITILGNGLMGTGLAQVFALGAKVKVTIWSVEIIETAFLDISNNLTALAEKGVIKKEEAEEALSRIDFNYNLEDAVKEADLVVESVVEIMDIKQNLFAEVEKYCKDDAILATNTSVMSITEIASKSKTKHRIVGTHFWNPPYLIPLVEVIKGEETSDEVFNEIYDYLNSIGKKPVKCHKDVPGFIANRLQHALWREAFSIVERGIADAKTVDEALRYGPGLRWPIMGVLENADMVGLDLSLNIQEYILPHLEDSHKPSEKLVELVNQGNLGFKTGKGYESWTIEEQEESRKRLKEYLIEVVKTLE